MKYLLFDANYLARRAFHSSGELSLAGIKTGVIYGFLREVAYLKRVLDCGNCAFAFDCGRFLRFDLYPNYKADRIRKKALATDWEKEVEEVYKDQLMLLQADYLLRLGYKNVFAKDGFEADDLIGRLCKSKPVDSQYMIVSADQDFYQLLGAGVAIYHPQKRELVTQKTFTEKYAIAPAQWPLVKALAGCHSDSIKGIPGVGEKTAIRYIENSLKPESRMFKRIVRNLEKGHVLERRLRLVTIPFPGTPELVLRKDKSCEDSAWIGVLKELGFKTVGKNASTAAKRAHKRGLGLL